MKKFRIRQPVINRWTVVDAGDNPGAKIVLFKNRGGLLNTEVDINKNGKRKGDEANMNLKEILEKMAKGTALTKEEQDFFKSETEAQANEIQTLKDAAVIQEADLKKAKDRVTEVEDELKEVKKEEPPKTEDLLKDANPELKKSFTEMQERLEKAENQQAVSDKKIDNLQTTIEKEKMVAKVKTEMPGISEDPDKLADAMLKISKAAPDEFALIEETLTKANKAVVEGNLLKSIGSDEEGASGDVENEITTLAKELKKSKPELSDAQAEAQILEDHPELYGKYKDQEGVAS